MSAKHMVQLALETLSCSQKELALRVGVSPTQISKWKKDEYMSLEMDMKFRKILGLGNRSPSFIVWSGSHQNAEKWATLFRNLATTEASFSKNSHIADLVNDNQEGLWWLTFYILRKMGVDIPQKFPEELESAMDSNSADDEELGELLDMHPITSAVSQIYSSFEYIYEFYANYIRDIVYDDDIDHEAEMDNIEPCLMELAATKIAVDEEFAPAFDEFRDQVEKNYLEWLSLLKELAFRAGIPLKAELLDIVYETDSEEIYEKTFQPFGNHRLHPDCYMNELLLGMRFIQHALPLIMDKLGINFEDVGKPEGQSG